MIGALDIITKGTIVYRTGSKRITLSLYEVVKVDCTSNKAHLRSLSKGIEGIVPIFDLSPYWLQPSDKIKVVIDKKLEKGRVLDIEYTHNSEFVAKIELLNGGGCVLLLPDSCSGIIF